MDVMTAFFKREAGNFGRIGDPADAGKYAGAGTMEEAIHHLYSVVPEVNIPHLAITLLSIFIVFFGLFSGLIKERLFIGEAIIATVFGIAFSGYSAGIFAPRTWSEGHHFDELTLELTRIVIALSVFAVGVELPRAYVLKHWRSLSMLLGPIMLIGWLVSGALIYAIIPGLDFLPSLVVAAGVTPTDPILASSVVGKGKFAQEHVPAHVRHLLQAESGSNDGAAFPFLYLAMFLLMRDHYSVGEAIGWWFVLVVLYQIVLGCFIGAMVGIIARKLLKFSKRRELIDRESMVAMYVALALFVTGATTLAGSDDLLAAFACGTAFAWDDWFTESIEESNFSSTVDLLANCAMFIYIGATMPFAAWTNATLTLTWWRLVVLALAILGLRRLPGIYFMSYWIPDIKTRREAVFCGHFGPIGVGAIFISTLAASKLPTPNVPAETAMDILSLSIQPITYFLVLSSILVHGLTISFFSLGRRVHSRVTSISRTFTGASGAGEEPSWMARVKRARAGEDIVINRDDDDDEVSRAEKGAITDEEVEEKGSDLGTLALFHDGGVTNSELEAAQAEEEEEEVKPSGSGSSNNNDSEEDEGLTPMERENDDNPRKNILVDRRRPVKHHDHASGQGGQKTGVVAEGVVAEGKDGKSKPLVDAIARDKLQRLNSSDPLAKEARYCKGDQVYTDGAKIIVSHKDGTAEVIDTNPTAEAMKEAHATEGMHVLGVPHSAIEEERERSRERKEKFESHEHREQHATRKVALGMLRRGSLATENAFKPLMKQFDDGLTPEQREAKHKRKLERDAWCRAEKHYREASPSSRQEWVEGDKVVTETGKDGSVSVRGMSEEERAARVAKHLAALKALGLGGFEEELARLTKIDSRGSAGSGGYFSRPTAAKGKGKASAPSSPDVGLQPRPSPRLGRRSPSPGPLRRVSEHDDAEEEAQEEEDAAPVRSDSPADMETDEPVTRHHGGAGLSLSRTDRIEVDSEEENDTVGPSLSRRVSPGAAAAPKQKGPGAMEGMRKLFRRQSGMEGDSSKARSASPPAERPAIRFAAVDKPTRDASSTSGGRQLPQVGGPLNVKRK